jgi:hypothetical protein
LNEATRSLWLVDGYNVLRVSLSPEVAGQPWWTEDRRRLLIELASRLPERLPAAAAEIWVVFDRRRRAGDPDERATEVEVSAALASPDSGPASPHCVFATSADEWIIRALKAQRTDSGLGPARAPRTARRVVVTADRRLASRSRHHGAEIVTTGSFVALCGGTRTRSR